MTTYHRALELALSPWIILTTRTYRTLSSTIMDLRDDPHLDCCISRPGELGNPLGDSAAERLSSVTCPGEEPDSPDV